MPPSIMDAGGDQWWNPATGYTNVPQQTYGGVPQADPFGYAGPPAPTGGGGGGGGAMPRLEDILGGDPFYAQMMAQLGATSASDRASLKAARQRAYIMFGEDPGMLNASLVGSGWDKDIDQTTKEAALAATQSGVSTRARIDLAHKDAQQAIRLALARRGMLNSGETGYQMNREMGDYTRTEYDAKQKLIDYLAGVNAGYVAAERQREMMEIQAQQQALANWLAMNPNYGAPPSSPAAQPAAQPQQAAQPQPAAQSDPYGYGEGWNTGWWR